MALAAEKVYRANPVPGKSEELSDLDRLRLVATLKKYRALSKVGEDSRRIEDRKGAKAHAGELWRDGILAGRTAITANQTVSLVERVTGMVTKYHPSPMVEALNDADEAGATMIQGALNTNWKRTGMQEIISNGAMLTAFTRPILHYVWWNSSDRKGIGDVNTRTIPAHRCIIDDRYGRVKEMEYVGFTEKTNRAKLIRLFPGKRDEIENAMQSSPELADQYPDPLRTGPQLGPNVTERERMVSSDGGATFSSVTSQRTNRKRSSDPLAEEIEADFLWIDDNSPTEVTRPKTDEFGRQLYRMTKKQNGGFVMENQGYETVNTPWGPILQPNIKPKLEPVMETSVERKYVGRRFIAWIPSDEVFLMDIAWDGPIPLIGQRDTIALTGWWSKGSALRLVSLQIARNILYTIIFERLKVSLGGTWLASRASGLKANKLTPESGMVWLVNNIDQVKQFPVSPLDAAYFQLLGMINVEMKELLGVSSPMMGEASGRADSPATYDKLVEGGGTMIVKRAGMIEQTVTDWCEVAMWFMQTMYKTEHMIEMETEDGDTDMVHFNSLLTRGDYAVSIELGSLSAYSESAHWARALELHNLGIYALPMLCKIGHVPHWRAALKQIGDLMKDPSKQYLLGQAQRPATGKTAGNAPKGAQHRSHHGPTNN